VDYATGTNPSFVTTAALRGIGKPLDLIVANATDSTLTIYLGNGDGTFSLAPTSPIPVTSDPRFVVVGDFNGDGKKDLAVANLGTSTVSILLGNGDGTFTAKPDVPTGPSTSPISLAVGDFKGDGKL